MTGTIDATTSSFDTNGLECEFYRDPNCRDIVIGWMRGSRDLTVVPTERQSSIAMIVRDAAQTLALKARNGVKTSLSILLYYRRT
ncbi:hypothetical protein J1614_010321 [Plenodomus biglobosus]|nr:hypothetical protein J1614_010321 [Plenodomus biglobosus]